MQSERGSVTIMAITAMLVLATGAASYAYVTNRNVNITTLYANGLQAQYSAEAAVRTVYVAGQESLKTANGWKTGENSALADWANLNAPVTINLPNAMGSAQTTISLIPKTTKYYVQAVSSVNNASRMAYNSGIDLTTTTTTTTTETTTETITTVTTAALIQSGRTWLNTSSYKWQLPTNIDDTTSPAKSPGSGTSAWSSIASQVLFNDGLGLSTFKATNSLQLVFRVNYYIKLTNVPSGASSGSGYGIYYLAKKFSTTSVGDPGDPTSYVLQYDPGLHPGYGSPPGGVAWGAAFSTNNTSNWPYGAFLVKKTWSDGISGWQNEVWDESGSYNDSCAFQDNNELTQRYYTSGSIQPTFSSTNLVSTNFSSSWALQPVSTTPTTSMPVVTQAPTAFGYGSNGIFSAELTTKYRQRPPDLRIAYTLGNIAEGNPWQQSTYYPIGAKIAMGIGVNDALNNRLVWQATTAGVSASSKPSNMNITSSTLPAVGTTVQDGTVIWTVMAAPTPAAVANAILTNQVSIAKISMSDLNARIDSVNGSVAQTNPFNIPFSMIQGSKNKLTIELWADNLGNRIHVIRVNDVLALGFNDRAGKSYDIIPANWELNPTLNPRGTGIRVWNAAAEFYTADNYGQTVSNTTTTTSTSTSNYGVWGK